MLTPLLFPDLLTYLDKDMLIGRATQLGGSFIFSREEKPVAKHQEHQEKHKDAVLAAAGVAA